MKRLVAVVALFFATNFVLPSFSDFVFRFLVSPQTVLLLLVVVSSFLYALFFLEYRTLNAAPPLVTVSSAIFPPSVDSSESSSAIMQLCKTLLGMNAARIDAWITFHANETIRMRNPFSFLKEPIVKFSLGSGTAPSLMHFRKDPDWNGAQVWTCDFVLDQSCSDISAQISWLNERVQISCSKIRAGGRLLLRLEATGEAFLSFDCPMWAVDCAVSGSTAEVAPDRLRQIFLRMLEERLRDLSFSQGVWLSLGQIGGGGLQEYLRFLSSLTPYNASAQLALDAALNRMSHTKEDPVPVNLLSLPSEDKDVSPPVALPPAVSQKKTTRLFGRPLLLGDMVLTSDELGNLQCLLPGSKDFSEVCAGLVFDSKKDLVGLEDKEGLVLAGLTRENKLVMCWFKTGSHGWAWRELQAKIDAKFLIGLVGSGQNWHVIAQTEFAVLCVTVERWNSQAPAKEGQSKEKKT